MKPTVVDNKQLHRWIAGYARHLFERAHARASGELDAGEGPRHVLFAFCDHWEPLWGHAAHAVGGDRAETWRESYPRLAREFIDADGHHPRHSFFFPGEQYRPEYLDALAELARAGLGEVELHLHHDGDTREKLRVDIAHYLELFSSHGHLCREDGRVRYGFIHGNWCLANARDDGRWCGVDDEIPLLFETGCYADFTFPSAPDESQPNAVNQIYWPKGDLFRARAYENGERAKVGHRYEDRILMIEGPLALALRPGRLTPRIENAAITANDPATPHRIRTWIAQRVHVEGRPQWIFVKVHTHGAPEAQARSLLGAAGRALHEELTRHYNDGKAYALHYVTAREMFNIALAAMDGKIGDPGAYRDYRLAPPPVCTSR
jgi:hypothetical protein